MTSLIVVLCLIVLLILLGQIRMGCEAEYSEEGLAVRFRLGALRFALYPYQEKTGIKEKKSKQDKEEKRHQDKKKSKKEEQPAQEESLGEKIGGALGLVKELLPLAAQAAGDMKRRLRIDTLVFHLTWADSDPASAALGFGAANAGLSILYGLLEGNFQIKESDVGAAVDFDRSQPVIYLKAALTLTIGQAVSFGVHYGIRVLKIFLKKRADQKRKKRGQAQETKKEA